MNLEVINVVHEYSHLVGASTFGLSDFSAEFPEGKVTAVMGESGSGKSTLVKLLNGLLRPSSGSVLADGVDIWSKDYDRFTLRAKVGVVFQFAESQLFEETVLKDVMYGPLNIGMGRDDAKAKAIEALSMLGLGDEYLERSPFHLSGGEKRRVALAGILAMDPEVLVLDEIAAGLDSLSHEKVFSLFPILKERGKTVIFVTHSADDAAEAGDRIIYLDRGRKVAEGNAREVFASGLVPLPEAEKAAAILRAHGHVIPETILTMDELVEALERESRA